MTSHDPITAIADQLAAHAGQLTRLEARQAEHHAAVSGRLAELTDQAAALGRVVAEHAAALTHLAATSQTDPDGYCPGPAPAWWKLAAADRSEPVARLRAWVEQVYRPGYGHLAASLGACWPARHRHWRRPRHPPYCRPMQEEPRMTSEDRFTWGLILDVLDVLERHGYHKYDDQHTGRAVGVIFDLARTYEGTAETHPGPAAPSPHSGPAPLAPEADQAALVLTRADVSTVFAAAEIAADDKRYRMEMCTECPDQSCPDCQTHLRDAEAFDQIADRMLQAARTAPAASHGRTEASRQPGFAADKEAGQ
jgi:hypothetical protein